MRVLVDEPLVMRCVEVLMLLVGLLVLQVPSLVVRAEVALPVEHCDAKQGGCYLDNAYRTWPDRIPCKAADVVYPTTEEEIVAAVATAVKNNQKIKVATKYSHSFPRFACPGASSGVIISTKNYSSIVSVDTSDMTVTAQSGILMRVLTFAIADSNLALPYSPYWDALTLGGVLATGAHGSSHFGKGSAVHEYVVGVRVVVPANASEGYAKVVTLNVQDEDLNAVKVSLGVLGVISTVTLQLQPAFRRNLTLEVRDDAGLEDKIFEIANTVEFGDVTWFASTHQVVYRIDHRVPNSTPGDGVNRFFGFQPINGFEVEAARSLEHNAELIMDQGPKCVLSAVNMAQQIAIGSGYEKHGRGYEGFPVIEEKGELIRDQGPNCLLATANIVQQAAVGFGYEKHGHGFEGFPVIGPQHLMQSSSGCERSPKPGYFCPWDQRIKGLQFFESSAAIPMHSLQAFIQDMRLLRQQKPYSFCGLDVYTGFLIRFVKASSGAYLGAQEDVALVDFFYYRAVNANTPRLDEDVYEEIEQIAFCKYQSRPHWGKNRSHFLVGAGKTYNAIDKFLAVRNKLDPNRYFSSEWSDLVLGITKPMSSTQQPSCALEGMCVCTTDADCAPAQNYFCRPGRVYTAARVCRHEA